MAKDRFFIGPIQTGLQTDVRPWLIPDDAFAQLNNAYVYYGRVRKRFGTRLMNGSVDDSLAPLYSRLRISLGNTDGSGNISTTVPGVIFKIGQLFSVGSEIFTVYQTGTPATMYTTGSATVHTYNTSTGAVVINGAAASTACYFYPSEPVMGLLTYDTSSINDEPVYAFDTQFSYQYTSGAWARLGSAIWMGNDSDFFWGTTYRGTVASAQTFFVSNFNFGSTLNDSDPLRYWNGSAWTDLQPQFDSTATNTILTARCIVPFKDRLILLNVVENTGAVPGTNTQYQNRCRFSQNGSPLDSSAWREDLAGRGGYLDAPTTEAIITCEFLKDRLIVFFERSTWELVYTGNEILPFRWQQINTELGAESTFSVVPFDKVVIGVGNTGIHACNGANVTRIDEKIQNTVFEIHNGNEGVLRVYGIRDYATQVVYWTFPSSKDNPTYPTRVLLYNYVNNTWAFFDDTITCFGYYQNQSDMIWDDVPEQWQETEWEWNAGVLQSQYRDIVAGNQEGFVMIVDPDYARNAPSLQITDFQYSGNTVTLTVVDHNLAAGDFVVIENAQGITALNGSIFPVASVTDTATITIDTKVSSGTYTGGGTLARVSRIDILTKQYNFYASQGRNCYVDKVNFMVDRTANGEITVDYVPSSSDQYMVSNAIASGTQLGTNVLETYPYTLVPFESTQARLWHPIYMWNEGEVIQLRLYLSDDQMQDSSIAWSDFELHAMLFYATPTASRLE